MCHLKNLKVAYWNRIFKILKKNYLKVEVLIRAKGLFLNNKFIHVK